MKIKNRKIIYFILFFLIILTVLKILFYNIKLFLNITPSIKMGLYFTKEYKQDIELKKGDFVIFSVPEKATKNREYYQDFIKEIVATEEDEVIVKNNEIFINNTFKGKILEKDSYGNEIKTLNEGKGARSIEFTTEEKEIIKSLHLLTLKPLMYVANVDEETIQNVDENENFKKVKKYAESQNAKVIPICVKLEEEISELESEEEKKEFLEMMGADKSGLDKLIIASYDILGLMSYLTAGEIEVRAWTIKKGTKAPQAAGKIHSDIERGFIKAEIVSYDDLVNCGSMVKAREKGLIRLEGKDYIMKEGDIVDFKFNV